jgi:hypothetical protein
MSPHHLSCVSRGGASPLPESASNHCNAYHNHDVCQVEYSGVQRANANEDEVGDEALPSDSVNKVAHSACHDERKANE